MNLDLGLDKEVLKIVLKYAIILGVLHTITAIINTTMLTGHAIGFKEEITNNVAIYIIPLTLLNFLITFFITFYALKEILKKHPTKNKWFIAIIIQAISGFLIYTTLISLLAGQLVRPGGTTVQIIATLIAAAIIKQPPLKKTL